MATREVTRGAWVLAAALAVAAGCNPEPPARATPSAFVVAQASRELAQREIAAATGRDLLGLIESVATAASDLLRPFGAAHRAELAAPIQPARAKTAPPPRGEIARVPVVVETSMPRAPHPEWSGERIATTPAGGAKEPGSRASVPWKVDRRAPYEPDFAARMPPAARVAAGVGVLGIAVALASVPASDGGVTSATAFTGVSFGIGVLGLTTAAILTWADEPDPARVGVHVRAGPTNLTLGGRF